MLLENQVAVIYGASGSVGGAVARTFAREGARVFLKTGGVPESIPDDFEGRGEIAAVLREETLLNRTATLTNGGGTSRRSSPRIEPAP